MTVTDSSTPRGQIVAMGGGGFSMEPENPLLDDFVLSLVPRDLPRICFVPTASAERRASYHRFIEAGIQGGYAADDGAALHFRGPELVEVVSSRPNAAAYKVELQGTAVVETRLEARFLDG